MGFRTRTVLAGFVALATAMALVQFGLSEIARSGGRTLSDARVELGLGTVVEAAERVLGLGLSIRDLKQIDDVLERVVSANDAILAAEIFDPAGVSIVSSDRGALGEPVPQDWIDASEEVRPDEIWSARHRKTRIVGIAIENAFGGVAGQAALIVRPEPSYLSEIVGLTWLGALPQFNRWFSIPLAGLFGAVCAALGVRIVRRRTSALSTALATATAPAEATPRDLADALAVAGDALVRTQADVNEARRELVEIDQEI